jgi:hypothetical protein
MELKAQQVYRVKEELMVFKALQGCMVPQVQMVQLDQ